MRLLGYSQGIRMMDTGQESGCPLILMSMSQPSGPPSKGSITSQCYTTIWGPRVQTHELWGDILYPNNHSRYTPTDESIKKAWYTPKVEYYSAINPNKNLPFVI